MTSVDLSEPATRIGMLLGNQRRLGGLRRQYDAVRDEAAAAVDGGLDLLVAPEHLASPPYEMLRPWPLLAALRAAIAGFDAVGSVVAGLTSVPQLLADRESVAGVGTGRVGVALAAGYRREDFDAAGRDLAGRWAARADARRAVAADPGIPDDLVWSAASTPRAAAAAARDGVRWYGAATTSDTEAAALMRSSSLRGVLRCDVLVSERADAEQRWASYVAPKYGALSSWGFAGAAEVPAAQVLTGTADEVARCLRHRVAATAAHAVIVRLCWPDMLPNVALAHVQRFTRDVLPAVLAPDAEPPPRRNLTSCTGRI